MSWTVFFAIIGGLCFALAAFGVGMSLLGVWQRNFGSRRDDR